MKETDVFVIADNVYSSLGKTTAENFDQLKQGRSAVKQHNNSAFSNQPFYAALFDKNEIFIEDERGKYTKFEQLLIASITDALKYGDIDLQDKKTALIISSTKGNVSLLETEENKELKNRISLSSSAKLVN